MILLCSFSFMNGSIFVNVKKNLQNLGIWDNGCICDKESCEPKPDPHQTSRFSLIKYIKPFSDQELV